MRRKIGRILAPVMAAMLVFGGCGNKDIQFNYDEYGVSKTQLEQSNSEYVSLEKIQTIRSNGLEKQEDYINNIFVKFSRLMSKASGEVELIIAVLGGIIVPLKKYCDGE